MFGLGPATKIYVAVEAVDMRKGFEGLYGLVRDQLGQDPLSGHLFLFTNRAHSRLKALDSMVADFGYVRSGWSAAVSTGRRRAMHGVCRCVPRNWRCYSAESIWHKHARAQTGIAGTLPHKNIF